MAYFQCFINLLCIPCKYAVQIPHKIHICYGIIVFCVGKWIYLSDLIHNHRHWIRLLAGPNSPSWAGWMLQQAIISLLSKSPLWSTSVPLFYHLSCKFVFYTVYPMVLSLSRIHSNIYFVVRCNDMLLWTEIIFCAPHTTHPISPTYSVSRSRMEAKCWCKWL